MLYIDMCKYEYGFKKYNWYVLFYSEVVGVDFG